MQSVILHGLGSLVSSIKGDAISLFFLQSKDVEVEILGLPHS